MEGNIFSRIDLHFVLWITNHVILGVFQYAPCTSHTGSIMENSTPMMPWLVNKEHQGKQYSEDAMDCEHLI